MPKVRLIIASALLALAAAGTVAVTAEPVPTTSQAGDVGWGRSAGESTPEPEPTPTATPDGDVGWG